MIFSKKTIIFISNKVYKDLKANKARWTLPMTKKALDANELLCEIWEWWKDSGPIDLFTVPNAILEMQLRTHEKEAGVNLC